MIKPAIIVVGYNRPDGINRLLKSIGNAHFQCEDIPLIISIDESNKSNEVEEVARSFKWNHGEKTILRYPERQGLRKHIIQCGDLSEKYGSVIILEDDLIVSEDFYTYVCKAHEAYSDNSNICGVSLYSYAYNVFTHYPFLQIPTSYDAFLGEMVVTWGQSWTWTQWTRFRKWFVEHENKLPSFNPQIPRVISSWTRSWGIYFASFMAENHLFYVYPYVSRTTCFSDFGEHNRTSIPLTFVQVPLMSGIPSEYRFGPIECLERFDSFYEHILDEKTVIASIPGNLICVDLNNMKTFTDGKKYVVTNQKLRYKEIASFGLTRRPIIRNLQESISGNQIHLFELPDGVEQIRRWKGKRPKYYADLRRLKYEFHDISWRVLFFYAPKEFFARLMDFIKK